MFNNLFNLFSKKSAFQESESRFYPLTNSVSDVKELTRTDYLRLYQGWVYLCSSTIANSIGELKYTLKNGERELNHPHMKLVNQRMIEQIAYHMLLTGSAFYMKQSIGKTIDELNFLRSDLMMMEENSDGSLRNYRYTANTQYILQPSDVIHFALFNPLQTFPYSVEGVGPYPQSYAS